MAAAWMMGNGNGSARSNARESVAWVAAIYHPSKRNMASLVVDTGAVANVASDVFDVLAFGNAVLGLADEFPIVGEIVGLLKTVYDKAQKSTKNKTNCEKIAARCKEIVDALDGVKRLKKESWERLKMEMKNMLDLVDKYSSRGKIVRMFHADSFEEDFKKNNAAINDALGIVTLNLAVDNQTRIAEMERREKLFKGLKAVLDPPNFAGEIKDAVARFTEGTREWAFNDFDEWVESKSESRVLVLSGDAGIGKTGIMSKLVDSKRDSIVAYHFCRHDDSDKCAPGRVLCSIAFQLAQRFPKYHEQLEEMGLTPEKLGQLNVTSLFQKLLREPLAAGDINPTGRRQVVLIDALDECDIKGKNDLLRCIRDHFHELPKWLLFFVTTRPEVGIMKYLAKFHPHELKADGEKNMTDIRLSLRKLLQNRLPDDEGTLEEGIDMLAKKSQGKYIYLRYAMERVNPQDVVTLKELEEFPDGIENFYAVQFERLQKDTNEAIPWEAIWDTIRVILVACEPLHVAALDILVPSLAASGQRRKVVDAISLIFPVRGERVYVFHKSIKDWLVKEARADEDFYVDTNSAHKGMGTICYDILKAGLDSAASSSEFCDQKSMGETYALKYGVTHLCQDHDLASKARELIFCFDWLLQRALLGPVHELVSDASRVKAAMGQRKSPERAFELLYSALRMVQAGIAEDPWQLAGQLVARLEGYADPSKERFYVEEVEMFMETVRAWDDYEWYRPMGQTYDAAGGACVQTLNTTRTPIS